MEQEATHEVVVYHDETKVRTGQNETCKGHVLLFVPRMVSSTFRTPLFGTESAESHPCRQLLREMNNLRERYGLHSKLHFSEISGRKWTKYDEGVLSVMRLATEALRHKSSSVFDSPLCCKLAVIFYPRGDLSYYRGDDRQENELRADETMLRMLLKGGMHFFYDAAHRVTVVGIVSDGQPSHRALDNKRVMWQITADEWCGRTALREYANFGEGAQIVSVDSNHGNHPVDSEEYVHAHMLQLADLLLGGVIYSCQQGISPFAGPPPIGSDCSMKKKEIVAVPVLEMLNKTRRGKGFVHSGHYRSFVISRLEFSGTEVRFHPLEVREVKPFCENLAMQLEVV